MQFRRIGQLAHSAVRFAAVEGQFSLIPYSLYNTLGQLTDGDFLTGTDVDVAVADVFATFFIGIFEVYVLHYEDAGICHFFAPKKLAKRSSGTPKRHFRFADAVLLQNGQNFFFRTVSVDTFYRTQVHILAYSFPVTLFQAMCQMDFPDHGRQYMTAFQVEIIIRTVEIRWHDSDIIRAILQVETFAHLQSGDFGDCIRFVGIFQRRSEQYILFHRLFRITRINARAA